MTSSVDNYQRGVVFNPFSATVGDATNPLTPQAPGTEQLVAATHGDYYQACRRGVIFSANVTNVTLPVIASGLVSVFTLYNPPNSGVNAELVDFDGGIVNATVVVNVWGLYFSNSVLTAAGTFTTIGVNNTNWFNGKMGGAAGAVQFYSAYTHSGTPVRVDILTTLGAVTTTNAGPIHKDFNGKIIIPPGIAASVAVSTGAEAAVDVGMRWLENPV